MEDSVKFRVTNRATGSTFLVDLGETVLEAARRQGVHLSYSCLKGNCVSCLATVLEGDWHYPYLQPRGLETAQAEAGGALLCQAVPLSDLTLVANEALALRDIRTRQCAVRIREITRLTDAILRILVEPLDGSSIEYLAGQYLDFLLPGGKRRAFSIANAPGASAAIELHVRYVPGGGFTDFLFEEARVGTQLRIEAPLGTFFLRARSERPIVCVAGGTGFAPIKAIIEQYLASGETRPLQFFRGARSEAELYLDEMVRGWVARCPSIDYVPVLSDEPSDSRWTGLTGLVHDAVLAAHPDLSAFDVYMSGPPGLVDAGRRAFLAAGLPPGHLFYDSFEFAPDIAVHMAAAPTT